MPIDGTLFILALHGTTPTCEAWTVTPTALTSGDQRVDYHTDHDDLVFEGRHRGADSAAYCTVTMKVVEDATGFEYEGARWFRTKAACQAAIAHHAHVAMQWPCDPDDPELGTETVPATKHRFDDVLAYGAIMYSEGACNRVRFEASKPARADSIEGSMSYAVLVDGVHGLESYGYEGQRGDPQMYLLGPGTTMEDGNAWGSLCAEDVTVSYATDHVGVMGNLYFDRASCQAGTARVRYRESWLPRDAEEAGIGHKPLAGGC